MSSVIGALRTDALQFLVRLGELAKVYPEVVLGTMYFSKSRSLTELIGMLL